MAERGDEIENIFYVLSVGKDTHKILQIPVKKLKKLFGKKGKRTQVENAIRASWMESCVDLINPYCIRENANYSDFPRGQIPVIETILEC